MSEDKTNELSSNLKTEKVAYDDNQEALIGQPSAVAETPVQGVQEDATDRRVEISKKEKKDKDTREVVDAETVQVVSETAPTQNAEAVAQGDNAFVEQDAEGYSFLEEAADSDASAYSLGAAEASASGGVMSSIGSTIAGLSTVAQVGLAVLGAAAAAEALDDDDDAPTVGGGNTDPEPDPTPDPTPDPEPDPLIVVDFNDASDWDTNNAFGSSAGTIQTRTGDDGNDASVLEFIKSEGAETWAGVTVISGYAGSDLLGDKSEALTFKVHAAAASDTFMVKLENATPADAVEISGISVVEGWQTITITTEQMGAIENVTKISFFPDFNTAGSGQTYLFDDVTLPLGTIVTTPPGQPTSVSTTTLAEGSLAIFTDAQNPDITGLNINPGWGQAGSLTAAETVNGGDVLFFENFNYQGIDFAGDPQDLTGFTKMTMDIFDTEAGSINAFIIDTASTESSQAVNFAANEWTTVELDLATFTADKSIIHQIKFDGGDGSDSFYMDNLAFIA
jgi:hypothetical protein